MPLINCRTNFILTWSANSVIVSTALANQGATFSISDKKHYFPELTLNGKLLEQLKPGFKRTINWNKYHSKRSSEIQN